MRFLAVITGALALSSAGAAGETHVPNDCNDCPALVAIAPGSFERGALPDDRAADEGEFPRHRVTINKPFAIAQTAVTVGEFGAFVAATAYPHEGGCHTLTDDGWRADPKASWVDPGFAQTAKHPVVCVSWRDANAYVEWLSKRAGRAYRLLTEAEWELAARGGTATRNFWGDDDWATCRYANVNDITAKNKTAKVGVNCTDGFLYTAPVASFLPNQFGLYDMVGNAWQWTADCWLGDYARAPRDGSAVDVAGCKERVLRGGSWTDTPGPVRINAREHRQANERLSIIGFRVARDL